MSMAGQPPNKTFNKTDDLRRLLEDQLAVEHQLKTAADLPRRTQLKDRLASVKASLKHLADYRGPLPT
jgi:hypothetical protein